MTNIAQILGEREKTHGDYEQVARIAQGLKRVIDAEGVQLAPIHDETLDMMFTKIARIVSGDPNFKDHWVDLSGYPKLVADRCK